MTAAIRIFAPDAQFPAQAIVDAFLADAESRRRYVAPALAERRLTLDDLAQFVGSIPINECTPEMLAAWIDGHKNWRTAYTRRGKSNQVHACFNWAVRVRRIPSNPFTGILFEEGEPRRPVTEAEFRSLLRASAAYFRRLLMFLWYTGCRSGEARQICWDEVDWEAGMVVKQKHKTRKKTRKPRVIVLVAETMALLKSMYREAQRAQGGKPAGEIFRNKFDRPWRKETLDTKILRLRRKLGLPDDVVLHGIRHAFGTRQVRKPGANIKMVSIAMGHASVSTTERFYVHLDKDAEAIRREIEGSPGW